MDKLLFYEHYDFVSQDAAPLSTGCRALRPRGAVARRYQGSFRLAKRAPAGKLERFFAMFMRAVMPFRRLKVRQFYVRLLCALLAGLLPMPLGSSSSSGRPPPA